MATQAESKTADTGAAAAEKAYAAAADAVSPKKADSSDAVAKPAAAKIDAAVAEVKAAPKKAAKPARKATTPAAKKPAAKKAAAPKSISIRKAAPRVAPLKPAATTISNVSKLKDKFMTTDFTKTVKETTAEAQTRAKAAYDRMQNYAGEMTEFTKGNVEAVVESGKILGTGVQSIARKELEAAKGAFETVTADLKAMAAVKNPTDLFKLQGEIARRNFDAMVARASQNAEISMKLANEAFAPLSSRMSLVAERISKAA
jgi:phasin family protein